MMQSDQNDLHMAIVNCIDLIRCSGLKSSLPRQRPLWQRFPTVTVD